MCAYEYGSLVLASLTTWVRPTCYVVWSWERERESEQEGGNFPTLAREKELLTVTEHNQLSSSLGLEKGGGVDRVAVGSSVDADDHLSPMLVSQFR